MEYFFYHKSMVVRVNEKKKAIRRMTFFLVSGYRDSNAGPPAPKAGALTGLRYTPNLKAVLQGAF